MSGKRLLYLTSLLILTLFLLPSSTFAQALDPGNAGGEGVSGTNLLELGTILRRVILFLFGIVGAVSIIMIVVGGIRYIVASGDPKATQSARATVTFAVIGLATVLLSVLIVSLVGNALGVSDLTIIDLLR